MTPVLIVLIVFSFAFLIVKMVLEHGREEKSLNAPAGQKSLTTSELNMLIREAVEDANEDVKKRLDALERQLTAGSTPRELPRHEDRPEEPGEERRTF
ncbi:MAG: hypothetical protein ACOCSK_02620 [Rhodothermales bacterium]